MTHVFNPAIAHKRKERDVMKLLMSDYKVNRNKDNTNDFTVEFEGPQDSIYQGGVWEVHVLLPDQYPYKSPSIGFNNRIYHPNVDEASGSVCLDVINQTWSPMFDLINIFDTFLPQLLLYPNPTDPLNPDAAALMLKESSKYEQKVKDYVLKYATYQIEEKVPSSGGIIDERDEEQVISSDDYENYDNGAFDIEEDQISFGNVSELSETSDIALHE